MNIKSINIKLVFGLAYLGMISIGLYFLFSAIDIKDLMSYEFILANKDIIFNYKKENFLAFISIFFVITVVWNLSLGPGTPIALFGGFVFGKWAGTLIIVLGNTAGATLIYFLANNFFSDFIEKKFSKKFSKFTNFFKRNELLYYMFFRFAGGAGTPFPIQNIIPVIFNMNIKNYFIATLVGIIPTTFITVALGSGVESAFNKGSSLSFLSILLLPEIYLPVAGFAVILIITFFVRKLYFKVK